MKLVKSTENYLRWRPFFSKVKASLTILLKMDAIAATFFWIFRTFSELFFNNTLLGDYCKNFQGEKHFLSLCSLPICCGQERIPPSLCPLLLILQQSRDSNLTKTDNIINPIKISKKATFVKLHVVLTFGANRIWKSFSRLDSKWFLRNIRTEAIFDWC